MTRRTLNLRIRALLAELKTCTTAAQTACVQRALDDATWRLGQLKR